MTMSVGDLWVSIHGPVYVRCAKHYNVDVVKQWVSWRSSCGYADALFRDGAIRTY